MPNPEPAKAEAPNGGPTRPQESARADGAPLSSNRWTAPTRSARGTVEEEFRAVLASAGMCRALGLLNARTRYRFTGVYRLEPPILRNEYLFDRENPSLSLGGDVNPLDHTYCGIVAATHAPFFAVDSRTDHRLAKHPARDSVVSYIGVPVRNAEGRVFGTLCHFDLRPRILPLDELGVLESISRYLSDWLAGVGPPQM